MSLKSHRTVFSFQSLYTNLQDIMPVRPSVVVPLVTSIFDCVFCCCRDLLPLSNCTQLMYPCIRPNFFQKSLCAFSLLRQKSTRDFNYRNLPFLILIFFSQITVVFSHCLLLIAMLVWQSQAFGKKQQPAPSVHNGFTSQRTKS